MKDNTNQNTEQTNEISIVLNASGFDWNQYRTTIWLANAHVNDERFLKLDRVGVLIADIKKLLHIINEAQSAACANSAVDKTVRGGLSDEEYRKKNSITNVSGVGIQKF